MKERMCRMNELQILEKKVKKLYNRPFPNPVNWKEVAETREEIAEIEQEIKQIKNRIYQKKYREKKNNDKEKY